MRLDDGLDPTLDGATVLPGSTLDRGGAFTARQAAAFAWLVALDECDALDELSDAVCSSILDRVVRSPGPEATAPGPVLLNLFTMVDRAAPVGLDAYNLAMLDLKALLDVDPTPIRVPGDAREVYRGDKGRPAYRVIREAS